MRVCLKCEKTFKPTNNRQKWCKDCSPYYGGTRRKEKFCIDCGKDISYKIRANKRCDDCEKKKIKYNDRLRRKKYYYVGSIVDLDLETKKDIKEIMFLMDKIKNEIYKK